MQSVMQFFCVHNIDVKRDKVGMTTKEPESNERWTMSVPFTMGQELTIQSVNSVNSNRKLQTACYSSSQRCRIERIERKRNCTDATYLSGSLVMM